MQYPLTRWQWAGREIQCFLFGHQWKSVATRPTKYYGADEKDVPYDVRKNSSNYMFERIPWWRSKCARCRMRGFDDPYHVWHVTCRWAIRNAWGNFWWWGKIVLFDKDCWTAPTWKRAVVAFPVAVLKAWESFFIHFDTLPHCIWTIPWDGADWMMNKLER